MNSKELTRSTPSFSEFDPYIIPYQAKVLSDLELNYDYNLGIHEILLSGSVGCLREDALIETAFGQVPIGDIKKPLHLLTYHERSNQFAFVLGSDAYPKGKDYLYRVIGEHGEFVASGDHLIATSAYTYSKISDVYNHHDKIVLPTIQLQNNPSSFLKLFRASVLHSSKTILSLLGHCAKHIRQCDLQLQRDLNNVLEFFPCSNDAQEYDLFFCTSKHVRLDDLKELELKLDHIVESPFRKSMMDLFALLERHSWVLEDVYTQDDLELYSRTLCEHLRSLLFQTHNAHPQEQRLLLSFLLPALIRSLSVDVSYTNSSILKIERLKKQEWYWDLQVPNTHNYISNGYQHHNSAKSILLAHSAIRHCLLNTRARILVGRLSMPNLRNTIWTKILEHLEGSLVEGKDFKANYGRLSIKFANGSEIISASWGEGKAIKLRSLELSAAIIEELTENEDDKAYQEIKMRVGRLPHIKKSWIMSATNPSGTDHWAYKHFIESKFSTRHVYYSVTTDNPFLPKQYIDQLKKQLDPKLARRMIFGEWIDIQGEVIYYNYDQSINLKLETYQVDRQQPVWVSFDFNIAAGKPMSCAFLQKVNNVWHIFDESVIETARTADIVNDCLMRGLFQKYQKYFITGDAAGKHRDTRSKVSDYDIIRTELANAGIDFELKIPNLNPPLRTRHNKVNSCFKNSLGQIGLYVYEKAKTVDEGFRLVKLKDKANYVEDDSKHYQHITTSVGYAIVLEDVLSKHLGNKAYQL